MARSISIIAVVLAIVLPPLGIVLGIIALTHARQYHDTDVLAIVAIMLGSLGMLAMLAALITFVGFFSIAGSEVSGEELCAVESGDFSCVPGGASLDRTSGLVYLHLVNSVSGPINVTGVSVSSDGDCAFSGWSQPDASQPLPPDQERSIRIACGRPSDAVFEERFEVHYDVIGGASGRVGTVHVRIVP